MCVYIYIYIFIYIIHIIFVQYTMLGVDFYMKFFVLLFMVILNSIRVRVEY